MHKGPLIPALCLLAALISTQAQTAPTPLKVRMICYDILMTEARLNVGGGFEDINQVSSQGRFNAANGEMPFSPGGATTHAGVFQYTRFDDTFPLNFEIDIPDNDANQNGIYDLLEFSQAVATTSTIGTWEDTLGGESGLFQATWSKAANSQAGTCRIFFDFNDAAFVHSFEIHNYEGTWSSAVKENSTVHGPVTMKRLGSPELTLGGELELSLAQQGEVQLTTTSFTNDFGALFEWSTPLTLQRFQTEFYAFMTVPDGWAYTPQFDFADWMISVDDKNDGDGDGIPDLIDPVTTAAAPSIQIIKTANGIRLTITGDVGRAYILEDAPALPAAQWLHPTTVTLTASPHVVDLPAPTEPTFWRMRFP